MKLKSRKLTKILSLMMVVAMVAGTGAVSTKAWENIELGNTYGSQLLGNTTTSFSIQAKNKYDTIEVYRLADVEWENGNFTKPAWDAMIQPKIDASSVYQEVAATPEILGSQDAKIQVEFLQWLYDNRATNNLNSKKINTVSAISAQNVFTVSDVPLGIYLVKGTNTTLKKNYQLLTVNVLPTQEGPDGRWFLKKDITATIKFADLSIDKTIDGKYGETVVPNQKVQFDIYSEVPQYAGKTVKNEDGEDELSFKGYPYGIVDEMANAFQLDKENPIKVEYSTSFYKDDDGNVVNPLPSFSELSTDAYDIVFEDKASSASGTGIHCYRDSVGNKYVFANVYKANPSDAHFTIDWYAWVKDVTVVTKIGTSTGSAAPDEIITGALKTKYKEVTGVDTELFTRLPLGEYVPLRAITFDYDALHEVGAKTIHISYNATVTTSVVVGTDDNKNTATAYYQYDISGKLSEKSDEAYAWTYAFNLVKVDGTTSANNYKPLAGAVFNIYKEKYLYVPNGSGPTVIPPAEPEEPEEGTPEGEEEEEEEGETPGEEGGEAPSPDPVPEPEGVKPADPANGGTVFDSTTKADQDYFIWAETRHLQDDEENVAPSSATQNSDSAIVSLNTLAKFNATTDTDLGQSYQRIINVEAGTCTEENCQYHGEGGIAHTHVLVYPYFYYEDSKHVMTHVITSVDNLDGVTITGLEPASYVLVETNAPAGYNKLKEAMRFEIIEMSDAQAKAVQNVENNLTAKGDGSLRAFYSEEIYTKEEIEADNGTEEEPGLKKLVYVNLGTEENPEYHRVYETGVYKIVVKNFQGITLPSTGGMGTLLFTIIGIMLMTMVMVVIIVKRRGQNY